MSTREKLTRFIAEEFLKDDAVTELPDELDLVGTGIIDSLGVLKVIAFMEETFGVAITPEAMTPDNFSSLRAMLRVLQQLEVRPAS
jgi:acyl carrier protein